MQSAAFLFDLDGTLIDSEMQWSRAIVDFLADRGAPTTLDYVASIVFGHSWADIQALLHKVFPSLPKTTMDQDAAALRPYYQRISPDPTQLVIPSSVAFFKKASKLAPCVIVSGSPHADVEAAVRFCGLEGCVKFVLGAEDYGRGKPAPDGYLKAAAMLEVDASACVVVEDSTAGVKAGRAAGMRVLGIDRNRTIRQDFTGASWIVHDLGEIDVKEVFGNWETAAE
ncbi:MAG: HAD family phosphatase [Kiritimatiellae bacterium]|nr:HAD family phosphatase [Kiritimatiellia bacterium]